MPDRAGLTSEPWNGPALSRRLGVPVVSHGVVGSTMEEARRGGPGPVIHLAEEQRAGRGRHGRSWSSPPGNLYATIAWPDPDARIPATILAAIQAEIGHAVRGAGGPAVRCKWPNDGFVGGEKWCGLLAEHDRGRLLVGIGANLEHSPTDPGLRATCLRERWVPWPGRVVVAETLVRAALFVLRSGAAGIRRGLARWADLDVWPRGTQVRVETGDGVRVGRYGGLAPDGRLVLDTPRGVVRLAAGEAYRVRGQAL